MNPTASLTIGVTGGLVFCLFLVFLLVFGRKDGELSLSEVTVDNIRHSLLQRVSKEGQKEKLDILQLNPQKVLRDSVLMGTLAGILLWLIGVLVDVGRYSVIFVPGGMAFSVLLVDWNIKHQYRKWQQAMGEGIPILVDFMPSFLEVKGITTRAALEGTLPFLPEPLRSELSIVMDTIRRTGKAEKALMDLANRAQSSIITAVSYRLAIAWDSTISPNLFQDLREEIAAANELAITRNTAAKRGLFALVAVLGLLGGALLGGYPALIWLSKMMSMGFGS